MAKVFVKGNITVPNINLDPEVVILELLYQKKVKLGFILMGFILR